MSEKRILFFSPEGLAVAESPRKTVGLLLGHPDQEFGLAPGIQVAVEMTAQEALDLEDRLLKVAGGLIKGQIPQS